mmetsp:Transcript_41360/g.124863  ORF Transcript_41360/g.124863 Transcript_41360/m.124863 type:complete len:303 (-) Transcript_41360:810-1718(-)
MQSKMPSISFAMRSAACNALSTGSLRLPGRWASLSVMSTRYRCLSADPKLSLISTMSTTRTTFLCLVASSINLQEPSWISVTNVENGFAFPVPKPVTLMSWATSCCFTLSAVTSRLMMFVVGICSPLWVAATMSVTLAADHHSNVVLRSVTGSLTVKAFEPSNTTFEVMPLPPEPGFPPPCRRSTSSARRSCTPALAMPVSLMLWSLSASNFSAVPKDFSAPTARSSPPSLRNGCCKAAAHSHRLSSSRSKKAWMSSAPPSGHFRWTTSFLYFTSSSILKGNLPDTKPNITTPTAQQSTLYV